MAFRVQDHQPGVRDRWLAPMKRLTGRVSGNVHTTDGLPMNLSSALLLLNVLLSTSLGFPFWFLSARVMDASAVGLGSGVLSAALLCSNLAVLGAGTVVITRYPAHRDDPGPLLRTAFSLVMVVAFVASVTLLMIANVFFPNLGSVLGNPGYAFAFVSFCVTWTVLLLFDAVFLALRRADQLLPRTFALGALKLVVLLLLIPLLGSDRSESVVLAWLAAAAASCWLAHRQLRRALPGYTFRPIISRTILRQIIRLGIPNHAVTMALTGASLILPLVVTEVLSPTANAHWYVVWMIAILVLFVPDSIAQALLAQASNEPHALPHYIRESLRMSFLIAAPIAVALAVGANILLRFVGESYAAEGAAPLRILTLGIVARIFIETYVASCRVSGHLRDALTVCAVTSIMTIISASLGGHMAGLVGVALAWLLSQCVGGSWAAWRLRGMSRSLATP